MHVVGVHHLIKITTWAQNNWLNYDVFGNRGEKDSKSRSSTRHRAVPARGHHTVKTRHIFHPFEVCSSQGFKRKAENMLDIHGQDHQVSTLEHPVFLASMISLDILSIVQIFQCFHLVNSASQTLCACGVVKQLSTIAEFCHFAVILPAFWTPLDTSMFNTSASQQLNL